jgi:hypothetical protein
MQAALDHLNAATQRTYSIWHQGEHYTLMMPTSGSYPATDERGMMLRLIWMTIAAQGRQSQPHNRN